MPCFHAHVQLHKARSGWQGVETWIVLKIQLCCERFIVSTNQIHRLPHSFLLKGVERVHKDFFSSSSSLSDRSSSFLSLLHFSHLLAPYPLVASAFIYT